MNDDFKGDHDFLAFGVFREENLITCYFNRL